MEEMGLTIIIVVIVIQFILAFAFYGIAVDKGYNSGLYFVVCLLFGIAGWLLVAAKPDLNARNQLPPQAFPQNAFVNMSGIVCNSCGNMNNPDCRFCQICGTVLKK